MRKVILCALAMTSLWACKKDEDLDDHHHHEEEVITSLYLTLTDTAGNTTVAAFVDLDGPGGNDPTRYDSLSLDPDMTYTGSLRVLNESETPAEDITPEIEAEGDEHLVCYTFTASSPSFEVTYLDTDGTYPIGLLTQWSPQGASGTDNVRINLKHQAGGIKDGTCAPGESDIEVSFPIILQ